MPDCDYCEKSFGGEDAYLDHLAAEHDGELGRIDRRRVDAHTSAGGIDVPPTVIYGVAGVALLALALGGTYYVVQAFSSGTTVHEHGSIEVTIDGESLALHQQEQFVRPGGDGEPDFHLHSNRPGVWHMHPEEPGRLTVSEAFAAMNAELTADRLVLDGETYDATEDGVELTVTVNGEPVDPGAHVLEEGDRLVVEVQTAAGSG